MLAHLLWLGSLYWAQYLGVSPGHAALIAALQPLMTGVLAGRLVGETVSSRQWVGLGLGFAGVLFVIGRPDMLSASAGAYVLAFVPPLTMTAAVLLERWQAQRVADDAPAAPVSAIMAVQFAVTALGAWPCAAFLEGMNTEWTASFALSLLWLGPVLSFGSYGLLWYLVAHTDATRASALFFFTPPTTMAMAWLVFGEGLSPMDFAGLLLAGIGVALVRINGSSGSCITPAVRRA